MRWCWRNGRRRTPNSAGRSSGPRRRNRPISSTQSQKPRSDRRGAGGVAGPDHRSGHAGNPRFDHRWGACWAGLRTSRHGTDADLGRHGRYQPDPWRDDRRRHVRALSADQRARHLPLCCFAAGADRRLLRRHPALLDRRPSHDRPAAADEPVVDVFGQSRADRRRHRRLGHRAVQR